MTDTVKNAWNKLSDRLVREGIDPEADKEFTDMDNAVRELSEGVAGNAVPDEYGWLVERHGPTGIEYVSMSQMGVEWVKDASEALRCCRRSDAEQLASGAFDHDDIRVAEHMWAAPKPMDAQEGRWQSLFLM